MSVLHSIKTKLLFGSNPFCRDVAVIAWKIFVTAAFAGRRYDLSFEIKEEGPGVEAFGED
jgi:hypothetical protein